MNRNLIISTVGDTSCHRTWLAGPETPNFDLFLIYYGDGPDAAAADAKYYLRRKGFKFELLHHIVTGQHRARWPITIAFGVPTTTWLARTRDLNLMFEIFQRYRLRLAQPAVAQGDISYRSLLRKPGNILRYTPFVEVMCPIFTREAFLKLSGTFLESPSSLGLRLGLGQAVRPRRNGHHRQSWRASHAAHMHPESTTDFWPAGASIPWAISGKPLPAMADWITCSSTALCMDAYG